MEFGLPQSVTHLPGWLLAAGCCVCACAGNRTWSSACTSPSLTTRPSPQSPPVITRLFPHLFEHLDVKMCIYQDRLGITQTTHRLCRQIRQHPPAPLRSQPARGASLRHQRLDRRRLPRELILAHSRCRDGDDAGRLPRAELPERARCVLRSLLVRKRFKTSFCGAIFILKAE